MVSVTELAWVALAVAAPVCLLAALVVVSLAIAFSAKNSTLERTVEVLTRRLVALQSKRSVMTSGPSRDAIQMGPMLSDEPEPDPAGFMDPGDALRAERDATDNDWEKKVDRRNGSV